MRRFVCRSCGRVWYSAALLDEPCEFCGGSVVRAEEDAAGKDGE